MLDVEADGPVPGLYSMVSMGVVMCKHPKETFYGKMRPLYGAQWVEEALAVSGVSRQDHLNYPDPEWTINEFILWTFSNNEPGTKPVIISDNNAFDWGFLNWYLWRFQQKNIFGHSSRNLNDIYHGMKSDMRASFKHLRKTPHTHHPVDDAMGNVEALQAMIKMGLKIKL